MTILEGKNVVLGVAGSIAAYKVVQVARDLAQAGARVDVLMTEGATKFVTPLTFQTLTRRTVVTDIWQNWVEDAEGHVALGEQADVMLIAPATAQTIARLALGLADDIVSLTALATYAPLVIAPAMNYHMWENSATQQNVATLERRGALIVQPEYGDLASGVRGVGRLVEPSVLLSALRWRLGRGGRLSGRRVVVTAGGTREPLDPVRFISNASSGQMGYALAQAAIDEGADVTLISANVGLQPPWGATVVRVQTAEEMLQAVQDATVQADALIMAAAVSDYRPAVTSTNKLKKGGGPLTLELSENPDILASVRRDHLVKVGFAAETENLIENARKKIKAKGLAMIVANDAQATIGSPNAGLALVYPDEVCQLQTLPKPEAAARVIAAVADLLGA